MFGEFPDEHFGARKFGECKLYKIYLKNSIHTMHKMSLTGFVQLTAWLWKVS